MVTIEDCVKLLNDLLENDYATTHKLIETRYPISKQLEDSNVNVYCSMESGLGMLGVLQGLFNNGWKRIVAVYSAEDESLLRFEVRNINDL